MLGAGKLPHALIDRHLHHILGYGTPTARFNLCLDKFYVY